MRKLGLDNQGSSEPPFLVVVVSRAMRSNAGASCPRSETDGTKNGVEHSTIGPIAEPELNGMVSISPRPAKATKKG